MITKNIVYYYFTVNDNFYLLQNVHPNEYLMALKSAGFNSFIKCIIFGLALYVGGTVVV